MLPKKCTFPRGSGPPSSTWFLRPTWVIPNGISIGLVVLWLSHVPNAQTDTQTRAISVAIGLIYALRESDTAYIQKDIRKCMVTDKCLRFFGKKRPLTVNFSKLFSKNFHRNTDRRWDVVKFVRLEIGEIVRYILDKKQTFTCLSNCRYWAHRAQNMPGPAPTMYSECSRCHPNRFAFGRVIAVRVNTAKSPSKVNIRMKPSF